MSSERRTEQELAHLLDDLYMGSLPTYRDQILQQTARTRQRPAWSFLERWFPMVDLARQPVAVRRLPLRLIALGLLVLALLLALVATFVAGSRPRPPAPFGPAGNGLVAYASGGEILAADARTGNPIVIDKGPGDTNPRYSRDGTRLAFTRQDAGSSTSLVYVVNADGSGRIQVTPKPLPGLQNYTFSPNGKQILITASGTFTNLVIAATNGSGISNVGLPRRATEAAWRPPDGSEILFNCEADVTDCADSGIYAVSPLNDTVRTILASADAAGRFRGNPIWSPDGSLIAFGEWPGLTGIDVQTHIIAADGTGDHLLPMPTGALWEAPESWSNDGTRLLVIRGYTGDESQARPVAVPVVGGLGIEIPFPGGTAVGRVANWEWAPDDSSILGTPIDASGTTLDQVLLDPVAGTSRTLPWTSVSQPSWQRLGR